MYGTFRDVQVEEVAVKNGLDNTSHDGNPVLESFAVVAVDPVDDVQSTVGAQGKQVVRSDRFRFSSLMQDISIHQLPGKLGTVKIFSPSRP